MATVYISGTASSESSPDGYCTLVKKLIQKTWTTTADFNAGTYPEGTCSVVNANQVEITPQTSGWLSTYNYRKQFNMSNAYNGWYCRWWKRSSSTMSLDQTAACYEEINTSGWFGISNRDPWGQGDYYIGRFEGYFNPPVSGNYIFYASSDDGVQMFVEGVATIIDSWGASAGERTSSTIWLNNGTNYKLVIHHGEWTGSESFNLQFSGPGYAKQNFPTAWVWNAPEYHYGQSSPTTDFTNFVRFYAGSGTDSGSGEYAYVYLNGKCKNFPWDIRVTDSSCNVLPYTIVATDYSTYVDIAFRCSMYPWTAFFAFCGMVGDGGANGANGGGYLYDWHWDWSDARASWTWFSDNGAPAISTAVNTYLQILNSDNFSRFGWSNQSMNGSFTTDSNCAYILEANCYKQTDPPNRNHVGFIIDASGSPGTLNNCYLYRCTTLDGNYYDSKFNLGTETSFTTVSTGSTYADQRWVDHRIYRNRATGFTRHQGGYQGSWSGTADWTDKSYRTGSVGIHDYGGQAYYNYIRLRKWSLQPAYWYWSDTGANRYYDHGHWLSQAVTVNIRGNIASNNFSWNAIAGGTGGSVNLYGQANSGGLTLIAASGNPCPQITNNMGQAVLQFQANIGGSDGTFTPVLYDCAYDIRCIDPVARGGKLKAYATATGAPVNLKHPSGSAGATATATGMIRLPRLASGSAGATATGAGRIYIKRPITGTASCGSTVSSAISKWRWLVGSSGAAGTGEGNFGTRYIDGSSTAACTATGKCGNRRYVAGTSACASETATGFAKLVRYRSGSASAAGTATTKANNLKLIIGTGAASSSGSAGAWSWDRAAGTSIVVPSATATAHQHRARSGTATATATGTANLHQHRPISGSVSASGSSSGTNGNIGWMTGEASASDSATGNAHQHRPVRGSAQGVGSITGARTNIRFRSGSASSAGSSEGEAHKVVAISGSATASGSVEGFCLRDMGVKFIEGFVTVQATSECDDTLTRYLKGSSKVGSGSKRTAFVKYKEVELA